MALAPGRMPLYWSNSDRSERLPVSVPMPMVAEASTSCALSSAHAEPKAASRARASTVGRVRRGRMSWSLFILWPQRKKSREDGLVADGLFEPCTCVWQFRQARPCHMLTTFLPLLVPVMADDSCPGAAGG